MSIRIRFGRALWRVALVLLLGLRGALIPEASGAISPTPRLELAPQASTGSPTRVQLTPDERFVVTAGRDRAIRTWDASTGELLRHHFIPFADPDDARIDAIAVSPDGLLVAVGGDLRALAEPSTDDSQPFLEALNLDRCVLILDLGSGAIVRTLGGFRSRATALAWSADGRRLAVGLGSGHDNGVRIMDVASGQVLFSDELLAGDVGSVAFGASGDLIAGVRGLRSGEPVATFAALITAQGDTYRLAAMRRLDTERNVGASWLGTSGVVLADSRQVLERGELANGGRLRGGGFTGFWAASPQYWLYRTNRDGSATVRVASQSGEPDMVEVWRGDPRESASDSLRLVGGGILDLLVTAAGDLIYCTDQGELVRAGPGLDVRWKREGAISQAGTATAAMALSEDGQWLRFPAAEGAQPLAFNLVEPGFTKAADLIVAWRAPSRGNHLVSVDETTRTRHDYSQQSRWYRMPYPVFGDDEVTAIDVPRRGLEFLIGTRNGAIRKIGDPLLVAWQHELGARVVATFFVEARGVVVVASADGRVHLFRWDDGRHVLSYALDPVARRWLAYTAQGFFEASIGAEDYAGWVINRATGGGADFMSLSRFRAVFLLPGLVGESIRLADGREGARSARRRMVASAPPRIEGAPPPEAPAAPPDSPGPHVEPPAVALDGIEAPALIERKPPVVEALEPGVEAQVRDGRVTIRVRLHAPAQAPVEAVTARVVSERDAEVITITDLKGRSELAIDLTPPPGESTVFLFARNRWGHSPPAIVKLRAERGGPRSPSGRLLVLSVGVSRYDREPLRLKLPAKDARDFAAALSRHAGRALYRDITVMSLTDERATRAEISAAFQWLQREARSADTVMVFLAGHGVNERSREYYFLPREADPDRIPETAVSFAELKDAFAALPGRTILFVDTCHAGNAIGAERPIFDADNTLAVNTLAQMENNLVVFASSAGDQLSQESDEWGNGAFTVALIEGLSGKADLLGRGKITFKQLDAYIADRVAQLTDGTQTPVTPVLWGTPDFVLLESPQRP